MAPYCSITIVDACFEENRNRNWIINKTYLHAYENGIREGTTKYIIKNNIKDNDAVIRYQTWFDIEKKYIK